jgi:transposase
MKDLVKIKNDIAGIDIGSEKIFISTTVNEEVVSYGTFTENYREAIEYLKKNKIKSIVMEATGVYWIAFYEMLEAEGFELFVVNGKHVKNVPGRKTDVLDCQWLRTLHSYGLLRSSFIPDQNIRTLRSYVRLRDDNIRMGSQHIQHIQKALELMNIKINNVISQITGVSGLRVIKAIIAGEKNAEKLLQLCDKSIRENKGEEVLSSLKGNFRQEHIFLLKQALEGWEFYQNRLAQCDKEIEKILLEMTRYKQDYGSKGPSKRNKSPNKMKIKSLHELILKLNGGKDTEKLVGMSETTIVQITSEVGIDLTNWKTNKHFTSWLGLAPSANRSGKGKKRRKEKINTRAGQLFKIAVQGVAKSKNTALGGFYRRIKSRHGAKVANKATARKLAVIFYNIMTKGMEYVEMGLKKYQENYEKQRLDYLAKQAKQFNLALVPISN